MATDVIIIGYSVRRGALTNIEHVLEDLAPGSICYGRMVLNADAFDTALTDDMDDMAKAVGLAIKGLETGLGE